MSYSQNGEDLLIANHFGNTLFNLLSLGENNGTVLSNAKLFIDKGCAATLVEPAPKAFKELKELHAGNNKVQCINLAVSNFIGKADFFDSGSHLSETDSSLLSSLDKEEIKRWGNSTSFEKIEVDVVDFKTLMEKSVLKTFEYISIDCEAVDIIILKQIDLNEIGCKCLCIEWNSISENYKEIVDYVSKFGLQLAHTNAENLIFFKY